MSKYWDCRRFGWYRDSDLYTHFSEHLRSILLPLLPTGGTLCDMGCGAALLDMELAGDFSAITCIDRSETAIHCVREELENRGIRNIEAICMDSARTEGKWDVVLAMNYGAEPEKIRHFLDLARDRVILVVRASNVSEIVSNHSRKLDCHDLITLPEVLDGEGFSYRSFPIELEHGQPFRSKEEAKKFARLYYGLVESEEIERFIRERLTETEDADFPFYLPKKKKLGVIEIMKSPADYLE